jgi:hypothetical protein
MSIYLGVHLETQGKETARDRRENAVGKEIVAKKIGTQAKDT